MKKIILLTGCLLFSLFTWAQNAGKGMKALDAGDYSGAQTQFEGALLLDATDVVANFGMSRLHGIAAAGMQDKEKALEYLLAAEAGFPSDEKAQDKLAKMGVGRVEMTERREMIEKTFLEAAKEQNTVAAFDAFIRRFPESTVLTNAINYRNKAAYDKALAAGTVEALDQFITTYPDAYENKTAIPTRDKMASEAALKANTEEAYKHFLEHYPEALQAPQIRQRLNAVAFENAKSANTAAAFEAYIRDYPESIFLEQARQKLEWLRSGGGN